MKIRRMMAAAGVAAAVMVGGFASPASAATSGCGSSCDGKDPYNYMTYVAGPHLCSEDAVVKRQLAENGVTVHLVYSARCRTAWTRFVTVAPHDPEINSYTLSGTLRTSYSGRAGYISGYTYTYMVNDANLLAESCAWYGPSGVCTEKY